MVGTTVDLRGTPLLGNDLDDPRYIRTERGLGYRFLVDEPA